MYVVINSYLGRAKSRDWTPCSWFTSSRSVPPHHNSNSAAATASHQPHKMAARYTMKPTASLSISRTYMVFSGVPSSISYTQRPASQCRQLWQSSSRGATCAVYNRAFHSRTRHSQGQSSTASKPAASPTASAAAKPAPTKTTSSAPTPASQSKKPQVQNLASGLSDDPSPLDLANPQADPSHIDWTRSFHGLSTQPFSKEAADVLLKPLSPEDVEIKPDGIIYLPEIKYRRILNKAFGPGGWGLAPRGESIVTSKSVTREYALVAHGRYVAKHHSICLT